MADKSHDYEQEFANLMNGFAESAFEMSDEEVRAEIIDEGDSTDHIRNVLRQAVKNCRQKPLVEAQQRYDERVAALQKKRFSLPETVGEMREMLNTILTSQPALGSTLLTAQNRDFENLPDEDVPGYLKQLLELDALDDNPTSGDDQ
ncbi:MAG: hypothetical protein AB7U82_05950 [Blastocatellales bacterium]|nr:hypothetical protein [Acidobacteriota bacterium]